MENKKSKFTKAVEVATNLSIIAVALIGATVLVRNYLMRTPVITTVSQETKNPARENPRSSASSAPTTGSQISVAGINFADSEETVVLALSDKCHFCTESAPFYQRLTKEIADSKKVRVVAVFPQEINAGKKYLDDLNVPITDITQATLNSFGVRGTPTLVLVDKNGTVKQTWVGRLTADRETEVLSRLKS